MRRMTLFEYSIGLFGYGGVSGRQNSTRSIHVSETSPLADVPLATNLTTSNVIYLMMLAAVAGVGYQFIFKPLYQEWIRLNDENRRPLLDADCPAVVWTAARLSVTDLASAELAIIRLRSILNEFICQNNDVLTGLENAFDARYDARDDTPNEFICPITQQIIRQPLICDGHAYEYSAIKRWYDSGHHNSPLTRNLIADPESMPIDISLRERIAEYVLSEDFRPDF